MYRELDVIEPQQIRLIIVADESGFCTAAFLDISRVPSGPMSVAEKYLLTYTPA